MSYGVRSRARATQFVWDRILNDQERANPMAWCPVSDELIRQQYPGQDIDAVVAKMSDAEFQSFMQATIRLYRQRIARKKSTARYLRQEGRTAQADQLEQEIAQEEKALTTAEQEAQQ